MDYLGLFCLGVFAGAIAVIGLGKVQSLTDWRQVLVVVLPVLLSGAAMVFTDRFKYSPAVGAFPLGLLVSLLWAHIGTALDHIKSAALGSKVVGWAHVAAAVAVTAAALPFVIVPAAGQVRAEAAVPREVRIKELQDARSRANWGLSSRTAASAPEKSAAASAPGSSMGASAPAPQVVAASGAASR